MKFKDGSPTRGNPLSIFGARRSTTHEYVILFKMLRVLRPGRPIPAEDVDKITHITHTKHTPKHHTHHTPQTSRKIQCEQIFLKIVCYIGNKQTKENKQNQHKTNTKPTKQTNLILVNLKFNFKTERGGLPPLHPSPRPSEEDDEEGGEDENTRSNFS